MERCTKAILMHKNPRGWTFRGARGTADTSGTMVKAFKDTTMLSMGIGGAIGVVLGLVTRLGAFMALPAVGGLALYSLFQAVRDMKRKTQLEFQLQNLVSWFALFVSAAAGLGNNVDDVLGVVATAWLASSFIGGLLVRYGPADPDLAETKLLENPDA